MGLFDFFKKTPRQNPTPNVLSPIERYLAHLEDVFCCEPLYLGGKTLHEGIPSVSSMVYRDIPEPGYTTIVTYGLSVVPHPAWEAVRPELCMTVRSSNTSWELILGFVANGIRGEFPFFDGMTINFHERISDDSEMDAFLVFPPSTLEERDYNGIDIGLDYKIRITALYPIYSDEIAVLREIGIEEFWLHPNFDVYEVNRKRITK